MNDDEEIRSVLAVDFGTVNTYLAKSPGHQPAASAIDLGTGRDGLATALLYRQERPAVLGDRALEEFGDATEEERRGYRLFAQFKPDIVESNEAAGAAIDFLRGLLAQAVRIHLDLDPLSREVIFGIPSESPPAFRERLAQIAAEAGFGAIRTIDEPKGALYFHVQRRDIAPSEAQRGILVIDFGGGTCDFALLVGGEVMHSWGDMQLGGRLFDDLFYQWFIEQNPEVTKRLDRENAAFFLLWYHCRVVKERFSQAMALDRSERFRKSIGEYGRLNAVTWEAFLERATHYRPSSTLRHYLAALQLGEGGRGATPSRLDSGEIDLLAWFRETLRSGLTRFEGDQAEREIGDGQTEGLDIACVVLTGGSSAWPFVAEIVEAELRAYGFRPRLFRSDRPYAAICEGLALLPALQQRFMQSRLTLQAQTPLFLRKQVEPVIDEQLGRAAQRIADAVVLELFDQRLLPLLEQFRQHGGSVGRLEAQIAAQASAFETRIGALVRTELALVVNALPQLIGERLAQWFSGFDLEVDRELLIESIALEGNGEAPLKQLDLYRELHTVVGGLSVGLITMLVATVSGGSGMALILHGPLGLMIGGLIGLIIGVLTARYGLEGAKQRAKAWEGTPSWLIRQVLNEGKLHQLRSDLRIQLFANIESKHEEIKTTLIEQINIKIEREIEGLSTILQN